MKPRDQILLLVSILVIVGSSMIWYKHTVLGFPLFPSESDTLWKIEAKIEFDALEAASEIRLNIPAAIPGASMTINAQASPGYTFVLTESDGNNVAQWQNPGPVSGRQLLYLRSELLISSLEARVEVPPPAPVPPTPQGASAQWYAAAVRALNQQNLSEDELIATLLREINNPQSEWLGNLLRERPRRAEKVQLAVDLLAMNDIAARSIRGVELIDRQAERPARYMIKIWRNGQWQLYDVKAARPLNWDQFVEFQEGDAALFEVFGGENSELTFAVISEERATFVNAVNEAREHSWLVDFSIYSLPVAQQSTFKLLLLIPLGALVVVILRNLVGVRTSGTFMPILIALSFLQTSLVTGVLLFLLVVGTGLLVRSYMSRLHLLLVPRIAAVLVFVIIIYAAIGIAGHKMGFDWGAKVTFFPMIILAWTIERMSILWDEDGPREVFIQGGGSLVTASIAYLLMSSKSVSDLVFLYPEVLLLVLAVIVAIGSYSGYRLSDLRRFEPMERF